jgi:hypothetical protein
MWNPQQSPCPTTVNGSTRYVEESISVESLGIQTIRGGGRVSGINVNFCCHVDSANSCLLKSLLVVAFCTTTWRGVGLDFDGDIFGRDDVVDSHEVRELR